MRPNSIIGRRPREDRKAPVLGSDKRHGIWLIVDELRRGEMARAAKLTGMHAFGDAAFDWLGDDNMLDSRRPAATADLRAKRQ
jgi:LmbE family N-acetylglucosaminyl deacetylase